ncbi:MAG: hypothetical protein INQ03_09330 [Candidatus Heimdallarchaeota archaeon]|nr:hypothetical protein [Candidatus Heimdallarchaeota archaeon]
MKIREGFVANSSSSSFLAVVFITKEEFNKKKEEYTNFVIKNAEEFSKLYRHNRWITTSDEERLKNKLREFNEFTQKGLIPIEYVYNEYWGEDAVGHDPGYSDDLDEIVERYPEIKLNKTTIVIYGGIEFPDKVEERLRNPPDKRT